MKSLELTIPGRPVPWARAMRHGARSFTPLKQRQHREYVALELKSEAAASEFNKLRGPLLLQAVFVYSKREPMTWLRLTEIDTLANVAPVFPSPRFLLDEYHTGRPDVDNLVKQTMEAIEDSGILSGEDGQISIVMAAKVKR